MHMNVVYTNGNLLQTVFVLFQIEHAYEGSISHWQPVCSECSNFVRFNMDMKVLCNIDTLLQRVCILCQIEHGHEGSMHHWQPCCRQCSHFIRLNKYMEAAYTIGSLLQRVRIICQIHYVYERKVSAQSIMHVNRFNNEITHWLIGAVVAVYKAIATISNFKPSCVELNLRGRCWV